MVSSPSALDDEWLTQGECCALAKISKSQFFNWRATEPAFPPFYRIGARTVRYKRSEWQAFLERNRCKDDGVRS